MRVLVTGAAGFVGSHVVEELEGAGHDVALLDALSPAAHPAYPAGRPAYLGDRELLVADVRDGAALDGALPGVDAVVHQAARVGLGVDAQDLPAYVGDNDLGTAVLLAAMDRAGVGRLVLASSMVVYGEGRYRCPEHGVVGPGPRAVADLEAGRFEPPCPLCGAPLQPGTVPEDAPLDPRNGYAASKLAQEHLSAAWARATGGSVVALRYHNVYGPRMPRDTPYAGVASIFRSALERGEAPRVYEDGGQRRDFVHVRDVAAANLAALAALAPDRGGSAPGRGGSAPGGGGSGTGRSASFSAYNVASGEPRTVGEMAAALAAAMDGPPPVVTGQYRLGDVRHVVASPDGARAGLGWTAAVPFAEGVRELATAPLRG